MKRREFIENILKASGYGALALSALPDYLVSRLFHNITSYDAFENLRRFRLQQHIAPALFAQTTPKQPVIITIKVMNMIHTPMVYKLDQSRSPEESFLAWESRMKLGRTNIKDEPPTIIRSGEKFETLQFLLNKGLDEISPIGHFANLNFNKWFAELLNTGKTELGTLPDNVSESDVGPFPVDDVAIQGAIHLAQTFPGQNHSFTNTTLRPGPDSTGGGDLAFHLHSKNIVNSPLGIACFNAGLTTETTDPTGFFANHIRGSDLKQNIVGGSTVSEYAELLNSSVSEGFLDRELASKFDMISRFDQTLRRELSANASSLKEQIINLQGIAEIADRDNDMGVGDFGNKQGLGSSTVGTAKAEFIAQALMVKNLLAIPGKPIRNFSLFCNVFDMDGGSIITSTSQNGGNHHPLSNIEGMRQLAIGLNILAQTIQTHGDVYVVMVSEGGRPLNLGDGKVPHGMLLGPKSSGLVDYNYINQASVAAGPTDAMLKNPNAYRKPYDGGELKNNARISDLKAIPDVGSFLLGVVDFLESYYGSEKTISGLGNYIEIKRS